MYFTLLFLVTVQPKIPLTIEKDFDPILGVFLIEGEEKGLKYSGIAVISKTKVPKIYSLDYLINSNHYKGYGCKTDTKLFVGFWKFGDMTGNVAFDYVNMTATWFSVPGTGNINNETWTLLKKK